MKPIIGILATSNYMVSDDPFQDIYRYGNNYAKKIIDNGGIPLFIPLVDEEPIKETLELCDGLILPGGNRVRPYAFKILDYFYEHKKPILGICLGMQTIAMYSVNMENSEEKRIINKINTGINHWPIEITRNNMDLRIHKNYVKENTKLFEILNNHEINVNSVHNMTIKEVGSKFIISITSEDGLIEGIEYKDNDRFIIGVQFHPEVGSEFDNIFKVFINNCNAFKK